MEDRQFLPCLKVFSIFRYNNFDTISFIYAIRWSCLQVEKFSTISLRKSRLDPKWLTIVLTDIDFYGLDTVELLDAKWVFFSLLVKSWKLHDIIIFYSFNLKKQATQLNTSCKIANITGQVQCIRSNTFSTTKR